VLIAASSVLLLCGCAEGDKLADFSAGDAKLAVALPQVCEAFLQKVPQPVVTARTNARVAYTRAADGLDEADDRIGGAADCLRDQRQDYAAQKEQR
jgi:hypothetical protein